MIVLFFGRFWSWVTVTAGRAVSRCHAGHSHASKTHALPSASSPLPPAAHPALTLLVRPPLLPPTLQIFREVKLHSSLSHEHIIRLFGAFQQADQVVLVQEFADAGDLFTLLHRCGGGEGRRGVAWA